MNRRRTTMAAMLGVAAATLAGCGYSEEEMQAKLREIEALKTRVTAEQDAHQKAKRDLDAAQSELDKLKDKLKAIGANFEQQARALEEYRTRAEQLEAIKKRFEALREKLQSLTKLGLNVVVRNNRMVIQLPGDVLFDSGKETLRDEGKKILKQVAEVIGGDASLNARTFQVAGHTDDKPLAGGRFKDNWGLSVMRAREVLAYLVAPSDKGGGLDVKRWSAAGYGDTDPLKPNDSDGNRQANRRCELVVLPNVEEMLDLRSLAAPQ